MEKKTIIWHTPQEKLPEIGETVVFLIPPEDIRVGNYWDDIDAFRDFYTDCEYGADCVNTWAYLSKIIATSKALDVARCLLRNIELFGDDDGARARDALQEIEKIIKRAV